MSETTNIEWCDSTFNPWIGCTRVSPACDDCYAARSTPARTLGVAWGPGEARRRTSASNWAKPLLWEREHEAFTLMHGRRRRVFCASLADVFDNEVDPQWRVDLFALIRSTPHLDWLLLTKRIGNVVSMLRSAREALDYQSDRDLWLWLKAWESGDEVPANVWLGATVVNQSEADRDIPKLLAVPAAVRFLSIEPMLGPINIQAAINRMPWQICGGDAGLHWVICGGESGYDARPMHPNWARRLRDECAKARVPFLFKQWGDWAPEGLVADSALFAEWPDGARVERVGKKAAGRLLDGRTHDGFPAAAPKEAP